MRQQTEIPARESELKTIVEAVDPRRLVTSAFTVLGRVRHGRVFHPRGVLLDGALEARSSGVLPFPGGTRPVIARLSKGAGTPGGTPDVLGLAFRIPPGAGLSEPWDITLTSSGSGLFGRMLPIPASEWNGTTYSSLMPYRAGSRLVWLIAQAEEGQPAHTADPEKLREALAGGPLRFTLHQDGVNVHRRKVGVLTLHRVRPDEENPSFDPMRHCPRGIHLSPRFFRAPGDPQLRR